MDQENTKGTEPISLREVVGIPQTEWEALVRHQVEVTIKEMLTPPCDAVLAQAIRNEIRYFMIQEGITQPTAGQLTPDTVDNAMRKLATDRRSTAPSYDAGAARRTFDRMRRT